MKRNLTKKGISLCILLLIFFSLSAPESKCLLISESASVEPYRLLVIAIGMVESNGDTLAYNPAEDAAGYFQIRPIRLNDYNRRTGNSYSRNDLFNFKISEKIFLYFADQAGPYDLERIAKKWNGSGQLTVSYWNRIKRFLN